MHLSAVCQRADYLPPEPLITSHAGSEQHRLRHLGVGIRHVVAELVEERDEAFGIVADLPGVLHAELIGILLIFVADAEQRQVERHVQPEEAVLQGVISFESDRAA
jgi:hypothetical protein